MSEVYHIISGTVMLGTGPDLVDAQRRPATNAGGLFLNGWFLMPHRSWWCYASN